MTLSFFSENNLQPFKNIYKVLNLLRQARMTLDRPKPYIFQ